MSSIEVNKGDWVIVNHGFHEPLYRALRVIKVSPQKFVAADPSRSNARHFYKDNIHRVDTEDECRAIVERLTSSVALMKDEQRRSRERHAARVAKILRGEA